jgi:hypothetical protein
LQHSYRSAGVRFLVFVFLFLVGLGAAPASGAIPASPASPANPANPASPANPANVAGMEPAPKFLLEKIIVAGNRRPASARIVISESLLKEGQSYAEDDLRVAIRRIKRLPFIIEADFALRKGTERGRYELVVTVEETRPIFTDIRGQETLGGLPIALELSSAQRRFDFTDNSLVGVREFVGSTGLVFATVGSSHGLVQAGYTRYDLFGDGSFLSVALAYDPLNGPTYTPSLSAGIPLTVNQSLRATVSRLKSSERFDASRVDFETRSAALSWLYNTTDDPLFPTQGNEAEAALDYRSFDDLLSSEGEKFHSGDHITTFTLTGRHHRPLTARQSLSFAVAGAKYQFSIFDPLSSPRSSYGYQASVEVGHAFDLWQGERTRHWGDLRLESTAAYAKAFAPRDLSFGGNSPTSQLSLRTALVYRNPWAVVRLDLTYYSGKVRQ